MLDCPACGESIDDDVEECPQCGEPNNLVENFKDEENDAEGTEIDELEKLDEEGLY
jgi:uncharacterized membrane protein YvbJ